MNKNSHILLSLYTLLILTSINTAFGQIVNQDHAGFIQKYDTTFSGIGPEVYYLPPPRSKSETLLDEYKKINNFNDSIEQSSNFQRLINNFENTNNYIEIIKIIDNNTAKTEIIKNITENKNNQIAIGLLNELAKRAIISKDINEAEQSLQQALQIASKLSDRYNKEILLTNLFNLYLFNQEPLKANQIEKISFNEAKKSKSITNQAHSLVKLAMIQASQQQYKDAENTIIRQAIPLFNRAKNYQGKVAAWVSLAKIYAQNKQYPEAQWFLIQAKELSKTKKISNYNLDIEYLLGYSKFHQNNLLISQKELGNALLLARENGDKFKELSATQMLGEISIKQNKVDEAEDFLKSYWELRNQLF